MTTDDRFDDRLREAARDYNAPPASVPRDEMWERIAAARAARRAGGSGAAPPPRAAGDDTGVPDEVTSPAPDVIVLPTRRRRWQSAAWARALAAALLLAVGIGIGRLSTGTTSAPSAAGTPGDPRLAAENPTPPPRTTSPDVLRSSSSTAPSTELAANSPRASTGTPRDRAPSAGPDSRPATRTPAVEAESPGPTAESPLPYRLAAAEHLALTETLLTTVSADARAGRADSSITLWARDLLGTTRMLLDSPAARDPKLARLLQDLELVLAEVAQLHPTRGGEELRAIDRAVRQRGVLSRLRATMPAGPISAGT
jgi:hypothetical protein